MEEASNLTSKQQKQDSQLCWWDLVRFLSQQLLEVLLLWCAGPLLTNSTLYRCNSMQSLSVGIMYCQQTAFVNNLMHTLSRIQNLPKAALNHSQAESDSKSYFLPGCVRFGP